MDNDEKKLPSKYKIEDIDKAIQAGNFKSLTNNKFLSIDDPQALSVVKDLFNQVKRANPGLNEFSFSLLTLFSAVMEIWGLTQDREIYRKFKIEQLPKDLVILKKEKEFLLNDLRFKKKILELKTNEFQHLFSDANDRFDIADEKIGMLSELNHYKKNILFAEKSIRANQLKIESMETSIRLKHYSISSGGSIYTNMENNLLSKFERIGKLLDQYNLNPNAIGLSDGDMKTNTTATSGFTQFHNFAGDKKGDN